MLVMIEFTSILILYCIPAFPKKHEYKAQESAFAVVTQSREDIPRRIIPKEEIKQNQI